MSVIILDDPVPCRPLAATQKARVWAWFRAHLGNKSAVDLREVIGELAELEPVAQLALVLAEARSLRSELASLKEAITEMGDINAGNNALVVSLVTQVSGQLDTIAATEASLQDDVTKALADIQASTDAETARDTAVAALQALSTKAGTIASTASATQGQLDAAVNPAASTTPPAGTGTSGTTGTTPPAGSPTLPPGTVSSDPTAASATPPAS